MDETNNEIRYPIEIHNIIDNGDNYFIAFLPDFGISSCSAVGDSPTEALVNLMDVKDEVIKFYKQTGKELPKPTGLKW